MPDWLEVTLFSANSDAQRNAQTAQLLRATLRDGDLAIIMGAGDVYQATEQLLEEATR